MVEKSQLKAASKKGDISGVKDIVRAIMTGRSMAEVNESLRLSLACMTKGNSKLFGSKTDSLR